MANSNEQYQQSSKTNPGNQSTAGSATASCPLQACEVSTMSVECTHNGKGRNYILDVINSKPNHNNSQKALQVIAKPGDPDEIEVSFKGKCIHQNQDCPAVKVTGGDEEMLGTSSPYKFKVLPKPVADKPLTFVNFLTQYLIPDPDAFIPTTYTIQNQKCSGAGQQKAVVEVFPTFSWGGSLSFGFFQPGEKQQKTLANKNEKGRWGLQGKLDLNIGAQNWTFEAETKQKKTSDVDEYFPTLKAMVENMVEKLESIITNSGQNEKTKDLVKIDVTWPKVTIGGKIELLESAKNYNVDLGGDINLNFDPLINIEVKTDLLDWCIMAGKAQGYGKFLEFVRKKARQGVGGEKLGAKGDLLLELTVKGEIKSNLGWKKNTDETWLNTEGAVASQTSAGVTIGLVGSIKVEAKVFWVKITFGAEMHLKGARSAGEGIGIYFNLVATTDQDKPALGGSVLFTGASVYYTYYAEVGGNEVESDKDQGGGSARATGGQQGATESVVSERDTNAKLKVDKLEKLVEIFPYAEWPKKNTTTSDISTTNLNQVKL